MLLLRFLLLFALLCCARWAEAATRLAIIDLSHHAGLEPLLVAELSKQPELALVERAEIQRLAGEKQISALVTERQLAALGALLRADGLLVLEELALPGPPGPPVETARLVSVRHGACAVFVPMRPGQSAATWPDWAAGLARQVGRDAPSLMNLPAKALPLSILNLRAEFLTAERATLEAGLTRLLELRLGALPGAVLLERRRLEDAAFERSLEAADLPPLWKGAVLIDGLLETPAGAGGKLIVKLRLRHQDQTPAGSATVAGEAGAVPALVEALAQAVVKLLPNSAGQPGPRPLAESAEFFEEALWAYRAGTYDTAEQALASALVLGEKGPEIAALQAWLLTERAAPRGQWYGAHLARAVPDPAEKLLLFQRALAALEQYRAAMSGLPQSYRPLVLPEKNLRELVIRRACEFLRANDESAAPLEVTALRRTVHDAAGLPITETGVQPVHLPAALHLGEVALDRRELIELTEQLLSSDYPALSYVLRDSPEAAKGMMGRFWKDPVAAAAWRAMWERLQANPATRLRALLLLSAPPTAPGQAERYRQFLHELAERAPELHARVSHGPPGSGGPVFNELGQLLGGDARGRPMSREFDAARCELLRRLCETLPDFERGMVDLLYDLRVPAAERERVWAAFGHYRELCVQKADASERAGLEAAFTRWQGLLLSNNSDLATAPATTGLLVHRFWHPYALAEAHSPGLIMRELTLDGNSAWISPSERPGDALWEVHLADLRTEVHAIKTGLGARLAVTPEAVWVETGIRARNEDPLNYTLLRHDRKTGEEKSYPLPRGGAFQVLGEHVYIEFGYGQDFGLAELDPATGEFRVLVSPRRNPPQSPLDSLEHWHSGGVIAGLGGAPCVVVNALIGGGLYEIGGAWKKQIALLGPSAIRFGGKTLLSDRWGGLLLIDPARTEPEWWMAGSPLPREARPATKWALPMEARGKAASPPGAFRTGEVFAIERDSLGRQQLRRWFAASPREGLVVPLRFELPEADRAIIEPQRKDFASFLSYEDLLDPNRGSHGLKLFSTPGGLILSPMQHGFWFLPYRDLEAYVAGLEKK